MHEYALTPHSLYAAVSVGLETNTILSVLNRLSKTQLPPEIEDFVRVSTQNYGKVKLVLQKNRFFLESAHPDVLRKLLKVRRHLRCCALLSLGGSDALLRPMQDDVISKARIIEEAPAAGGAAGGAGFSVSRAPVEEAAAALAAAANIDGGSGGTGDGATTAVTTDGRELHSFEIDPAQVEHVKQRCLPGELNYPTLEEYDFRADTVNPDVPGMELKPATQVRPYQDKSLSKMFGNGRARSGIIVLPCGAGKSLTGIAAAARIRKSVLCLCTSSVSVDQWRYQFKLWTQLPDASVVRFTSQMKEALPEGQGGVVVSTYNMIAFNGRRSEESERILASIRSREWGLMLLDEVHVVPAAMFRKVVGITKAHAKLGLTATLVREDDRIDHLNFLIGPKLYEANWLDLQRGGFIANVQCAEVWCPMTKEFYAEYLKPDNSARRQALYVMNPTKFRTCQYLMQYHELTRGDKIIVFSDNLFALREYAARLRRPFVYGGTNHAERTRVLHAFKHSSTVNTIFLSKVGDNSIDIPEANVIIQISSHAGSRRQEAQRLGRILRPKARPPGAGPPAPDDYNAFFYSLVSTDTVEMYYSTKRQQFLVDQGYSFKVVTSLFSEEDGRALMLSRRDEQLALLASVMAAGEEEAGEERLPEDADELREKDSALAPRRAVRSMAQISGAGNMSYMEFAAGGGRGGGRGGGGAPRALGPPRAHHTLLRDRFGKR
jgi:DNA excision repair protein ERCC-3